MAATVGKGRSSSRCSTPWAARIDGTASSGARTWPNSETSAPAMKPLLPERITRPAGRCCSTSRRRSSSSSIAARDSELALAPGLSKVSQATRSASISSVHWREVTAGAEVFIDAPCATRDLSP